MSIDFNHSPGKQDHSKYDKHSVWSDVNIESGLIVTLARRWTYETPKQVVS